MQRSLYSCLKETTHTPLYEEYGTNLTLPESCKEYQESEYSRTSPCVTETTPLTPTSTSRKRSFDSLLEVDYPAPKKVKVKKSEQLIRFLKDNNIYCNQQWRALDFDTKEPFLTIPHLHSLLSTTFAALLEQALQKPLFLQWRQPRDQKIYRLLHHQGWTEAKMHAFLCIDVQVLSVLVLQR